MTRTWRVLPDLLTDWTAIVVPVTVLFLYETPPLGSMRIADSWGQLVAAALISALTLTALLGAMLKDAGGQLTMQAQTRNGIVDLLVADYKAGTLRGYVRHDPDRLAQGPAEPSLFALFGKGYLAITFDQAATGEPKSWPITTWTRAMPVACSSANMSRTRPGMRKGARSAS